MKKNLFILLDNLFTKSENSKYLFAIEKLFSLGIPFNKPHGIKFRNLSNYESSLMLPNKRINHNHLGGIHACAIATVGEFTAGLLLCKNFPTAKYRIIMKSIKVEYFKQARENVYSYARMPQDVIDGLSSVIKVHGKASTELKTLIRNAQGEKIAEVITDWQMKDWEQTRF